MKRLGLITLVFVAILAGVFNIQIRSLFFKANHEGLLNYDYGIVSVEDLRFSDRNAKPSNPPNYSYPYWQCFRTETMSLTCDRSADQKLDLRFNLKIKSGAEVYSFDLNRAISIEVCDDLVNEIVAVTKNQSHVCISGTWLNTDKTEHSWIFHRLKTHLGYAHYIYTDDMPR